MIKKDVKKHNILPHELLYFIFIVDPLSSSLAHYCISLNVFLVTKMNEGEILFEQKISYLEQHFQVFRSSTLIKNNMKISKLPLVEICLKQLELLNHLATQAASKISIAVSSLQPLARQMKSNCAPFYLGKWLKELHQTKYNQNAALCIADAIDAVMSGAPLLFNKLFLGQST